MIARVLKGAKYGAIVGLVCVATGLIRIMIGGANKPPLTGSTFAFLGAYVGGFLVCGSVAGVLWPLGRTRAGVLAIGYISGGILCALFVPLVEAMDRTTPPLPLGWQIGVWAFTTILIGTGIAYVIGRRRGLR